MSADLPVAQARPRPAKGARWVWLLPLLALALAVWVGASAWGGRGPEVVVHAREGHGLRAGDPLLYRGIAVGEVDRVELSRSLDEVLLRVRIDEAASALARAGTRFWIARPQVRLDRVGGLETLLGSRHLAVLPGPPGASAQREFVALDEPPVLAALEEGSLEILLDAPRTFGLAPGAPITFRQIEVGTVLAVGLSNDATAVEARASIRPAYAALVREDTRFWRTGGFDVSFALTGGLSIRLDSLRGLLVGGIALATPTRPGRPVRTGRHFELHDAPEEEWLAWDPALPLGNEALPPGVSQPALLRARLAWEEGLFNRRHERSGWLLPVAGGVVAPADLLDAGPDAEEPSLEVGGERIPLSEAPAALAAGLARRPLEIPGAVAWPRTRMEAIAGTDPLLVVADPALAPVALEPERLEADGPVWRVDPALSFDETWHGAAVLARSNGALVGLLLVEEGKAHVVPLSAVLELPRRAPEPR